MELTWEGNEDKLLFPLLIRFTNEYFLCRRPQLSRGYEATRQARSRLGGRPCSEFWTHVVASNPKDSKVLHYKHDFAVAYLSSYLRLSARGSYCRRLLVHVVWHVGRGCSPRPLYPWNLQWLQAALRFLFHWRSRMDSNSDNGFLFIFLSSVTK